MINIDELQNSDDTKANDLMQSISAGRAFIELISVFLGSKDRPSIPRMMVNSALLLTTFALSIVVLFGLPLTLIVLVNFAEDPNQTFSLDKIGFEGFQVSPAIIIFGYLVIYAISIICSYLGRRMLVTDNTNYIAALTDSVGDAFDTGIKRNLFIPDMEVDKALYNRISLSGTRILPRLHMALLSGVMPAVFASISLSMLLFVDFWMGVGVMFLVLVSIPFIIRSANRSIYLTQAHLEDLKAFNQSYRDYTGEVIFASELEWNDHNNGSLYERLNQDRSSSLKKTRENFFTSLISRQIATDQTRVVVGAASVIILGLAFFYYLYVPWAEIRMGTVIFLVLGFRYFFVALNGLSVSFVSISTSYNYLHEILKFQQNFKIAQKQTVSAILPESLVFMRADGEAIEFQPYNVDLIEVILDATNMTYSDILEFYTKMINVDGPHFLDTVTTVGFPGRNYRKSQDLNDWVIAHPLETLTELSLPNDSEFSTIDKLKLLFEDTYFAGRGLVLPDDLWNMLLEWVVHRNNSHNSKTGSCLILNGALLARLPSATRKIIIDKTSESAVFVVYYEKPMTFISDKDLDVLVVTNNTVTAHIKSDFG